MSELRNIEISHKNKYKKNQQALKSLDSYLEQLKIHYDLNDKDLVKILQNILKFKNKGIFLTKIWNIFK